MSTQAGVFVLQGDQSIVPMQPAQFATEAQFQDLLARFPGLLVGDQIDPDRPRRWVLVKQEQSVGLDDASGGRWSIDHVFVDQDGVPTLVEIKRQTDTRIRREVVGQMLDYAANCATFWTPGSLRSSFEQTCASAGRSSADALSELLRGDGDPDGFWPLVDKNLADGRIRLLFVADAIPIELRRIVEFLNRQMDPAEVLAIELRQFEGQGLRTIVPTVLGRTEADGSKRPPQPAPAWTEERFFARFEEKFPAQVDTARAIFDVMREHGDGMVFGTGRVEGSAYPLFRPQGVRINPVYLSTEGKLWFQFDSLKGKPIFGDMNLRRELMKRFSIEGAGFVEADLVRWKAIPLSTIAADAGAIETIRAAFVWLDQTVKADPKPQV